MSPVGFRRNQVSNGEVISNYETEIVPEVDIRIGTGVRRFKTEGANVVAVFGGPGSMKGVLTDAVLSTFNFQLISSEDVILSYLPNKVGNSVQTAGEIQELLRDDPALLSLDWVLHLIGAKISTSTHNLFFIDLIPSIISMLKVQTFMKTDVTAEMNRFESRHKILFAINLSIAEDRVYEAILTPTMAHKLAERRTLEEAERKANEKEEDAKENGSAAKDKSGKDANGKDQKEKEKAAFEDSSDEADTNRTTKRRNLYLQSVAPFLNYFDQTDRLIQLEIIPQQPYHIGVKLLQALRDLGFRDKSDSIRIVVLFIYDENELQEISSIIDEMEVTYLSEIVDTRNDFLDHMMLKVDEFIQMKKAETGQHVFVIILDCVNTRGFAKLKRIAFIEVVETSLDRFIDFRPKHNRSKPMDRPVKAITSSVRNMMLLFTESISVELCRKVGACFMNPDKAATAAAK